MKNTWCPTAIAAISLCFFSCSENKQAANFVLEGHIEGLADDTIAVKDRTSYNDTLYTTVSTNGRFKFEIGVDTLSVLEVLIENKGANFYIYADKGATVRVTGNALHLQRLHVEGGPDENKVLTEFNAQWGDSLAALRNIYTTSGCDSAAMCLNTLLQGKAIEFVTANRLNYASAAVFDKYLYESPYPDYTMMSTLIEKMGGFVRDLPNIQLAQTLIDKKTKALPNKHVYTSSFKCTDGSTVERNDLSGNYVFLEFWSSQSDSSLAYRKKLKDVYEKYKNASITDKAKHHRKIHFIGVSLDTDSAACAESAKSSGVAWKQVFDGKSFASDIANRYAVTQIPYNVLIAPNSRIIGCGLSVEALADSLENIFQPKKNDKIR